MKSAIWGAGIIMLGTTALMVVNYIGNLGTNNELDYYAVKEVTEAAMVDAVDIAYFRSTGRLRISSERFTNNFTQRLAMVAGRNRDYTIEFRDIVEEPPRVSVNVISEASHNADLMNIRFNNDLNALLLLRLSECADQSGACDGGVKRVQRCDQ